MITIEEIEKAIEKLSPEDFARLREWFYKYDAWLWDKQMAQKKVFYDRTGNTLTVWFANPQDEYVSEETGDEVILMKDKAGRVIGFEKLNFAAGADQMRVAFETVTA